MFPLARIQIPEPQFSEPTLYVRSSAGTIDSAGLHLVQGDRVTFDTAFGVFAAGRWSRLTSIADLVATMDITGRARVELIAYANGVDSVIAFSEEGDDVTCDAIRAVGAESFYIAVTALENGVIVRGGEWGTKTPPTRNVHLGVAITTFNRQEYVLATIDKLVALEAQVNLKLISENHYERPIDPCFSNIGPS